MLNQEQLISKIKGYNDFVDVEKLKEAYSFAEKVHAQQKKRFWRSLYKPSDSCS